MTEQVITGRCYCGNVNFEVKNEKPLFSLFCHCSDCRRAHGSPMYSTAIVPQANVEVTKGEEFIKEYRFQPVWATSKCCSRSFCSNCGSRIYNEMEVIKPFMDGMPAGNYVGLLHGNLDNFPDSFKPSMHLFCKEAIFDVSVLNDDIPHFESAPGSKS